MFSKPGRKPLAERDKNEEEERKELSLRLAVYGSPAPRRLQQDKASRSSRTLQLPTKQRNDQSLPFPVERILLLAERLELSTLRERTLESVSLSAVALGAQDVRGGEEPLVSRCAAVFGGTGRRSPGLVFPLDLSSVSQEDEDSEESCGDVERVPEEKSSHHTEESSESSDRVLGTSSRAPFGRKNASKRSEDFGTQRDPGDDLINLYIKAVDNRDDLVRFLRPCHACKGSSCVCPDSQARPPVSSSEVPCGGGIEAESSGNCWRCRDGVESCCSLKINKSVETEASVTRFGCGCAAWTSAECFHEECLSRSYGLCSENRPDPYLPEGCTHRWFCRCAAEDDAVGYPAAENSAGGLDYASSLANAARSARVLARDLELVLSNFKIDFE